MGDFVRSSISNDPDPQIETEHLSFRPLKLGDEKYVFPEVDEILTEHWIGWEPPKDIEETRREIAESVERARQTPCVECMIFDKVGAFIGRCDISRCTIPISLISLENPEYEMNLWI